MVDAAGPTAEQPAPARRRRAAAAAAGPGARTSYHAGLSRDAVVTAAVRLLQSDGAKQFSVRRLAGQLGVDSMALYKHVRGKDDLLGAALGQVLNDVRPSKEGPWWERAGSSFRAHRQVVHAHPWILTLMHDSQIRSAEPWAGADETLRLLEGQLGLAGAGRWFRWLAAFTNGFLLTEPDPAVLQDLDEIDENYPRVLTAAKALARSSDEDFDAGLAILLGAMRQEAESAAERRPPTA